VCSALLLQDEELLKALPERLKPIVESARFRSLLANREAAWGPFHSAMDLGLEHEGRSFFGSIGDLRAWMSFRRTKKGELQLWVEVLAKKDVPFGQTLAGDGFQFLDFVGAELAWIAKARATGKLKEGLAIVGADLRGRRLVDLLETLGFEKGGLAGPRCYIMGVVGGLVGYGGGRVYFSHIDADVENGSVYEERRKFYRDVVFGSVAGAGTAVALACFRKTGRNYSIEFNPHELPPLPEKRPPGEVPPIDQTPPVVTDPIPAGT
jgi:hypothetical protein